MTCVVRSLGDDELLLYLEIVNASIAGLAVHHYSPEAIQGWLVPVTHATLADLAANTEQEIRLVAELDGRPVGIGALVVEGSELRACYVLPAAARQGVGTALVQAIEARAVMYGLDHLDLSASLNAAPFYAALGYRALEHRDVVLRSGHRLAAVRMQRYLFVSPSG
jgi:putative acetyltransferase